MNHPKDETPTESEKRQPGGGPCSCGHDRYAHLHMPAPDGDGLPWLGSCFACHFACKQYDGVVPESPTDSTDGGGASE